MGRFDHEPAPRGPYDSAPSRSTDRFFEPVFDP